MYTEAVEHLTRLPACMGGWCDLREGCALYIKDNRERVVERLCTRGLEHPIAIVFKRPQQGQFYA